MTRHWSAGSMPTRSSRQPWGMKVPNRMSLSLGAGGHRRTRRAASVPSSPRSPRGSRRRARRRGRAPTATAPVVPLPAKKSSTRSPGRLDAWMIRRRMPSGFCVGIAGLLAPGRRHDRVPPDVGGELAALGLLGRHEPRSHVGLAVDGIRVEPVARRILDVHQDRVVLGRPALAGLGAVVVRPDQLVEEAVAAEQSVEQHLRVVRLAVVEMQVQRAVVGEQAPRLFEPRLEEAPVVVEPVVVGAKVAAQPLVLATVEAAADDRCGISPPRDCNGAPNRRPSCSLGARSCSRRGAPGEGCRSSAVSTARVCVRPVLNGGSR